MVSISDWKQQPQKKSVGFKIIVGKQQTHLNNVPVVCELIQVGAVEADGCERGGT